MWLVRGCDAAAVSSGFCCSLCDWQEPSHLKLLQKFGVWLNMSPPLNPTWLPSWLPLTRAGQRIPCWNIVIERLQSKQRNPKRFPSHGPTRRPSDSPTCGNKRSSDWQWEHVHAGPGPLLLCSFIISYQNPQSQRQLDKKKKRCRRWRRV